ncbi:MAG: 30S ribosomal protein S3 [Candidatus Eisenbacteria bacterium]|nr:30S ribosomal protein S3 [Candidatus Eisenbacteria bacterium]
MGQKTHPIGLRLGIIKTWDSRWFATRNYANLLKEDLFIRKYVKSRLQRAGISKIEIDRAPKKVTIMIHTARPGIVIGRKGQEVDQLRDELQHLTKKEIYINIKEVARAETDAQLIAEHIASQLKARMSFRRVLKKSVASAMRMGAKGIKVAVSGRLSGAEMARREGYKEGRIPLHTLRADIDYAQVTAHTTFGCIGVKVWVFKGEVFGKRSVQSESVGTKTERH